ncbi:pyridoxamine 5'-phosphate oxidase family protein [Pelagovum pacificum]|uniref:Pyridoxamine 5'-phosphate oxidase n=1 Tax=Pelagovum pacificum TaxID=2588711 RepID=A0A5C5GGQ0_9RHOB|nr:pyridoxamine 5'-phosphate oxidase family protein [Pelagovum pacificum]QQA42945.1 pyridoxamine 5'-phosphate oxidase family protein [Pelagovum pacificum]TNY33912.1 pyridoxamine 5'-phosphate oxidase [Pelagovum pacificum]
MSDIDSLPGLLASGWSVLQKGRQVAFANVSNGPDVRTVVLRGVRPELGEVDVHTDIGSSKVAALRADPACAILFWDEAAAIQVRLYAEATILAGDAVRDAWDKVPDASQTAYGKVPPPGTPIDGSLDYRLTPGPENFVILLCRASRIDLVHLGEDHRRAVYERADGWAGRWLSP